MTEIVVFSTEWFVELHNQLKIAVEKCDKDAKGNIHKMV